MPATATAILEPQLIPIPPALNYVESMLLLRDFANEARARAPQRSDGRRVSQALRDYRQKNGLHASGQLDDETKQ
jgi:hypothetical protein